MKRLLVLCMLAALAGCNSGTGNDDGDNGDLPGGNTGGSPNANAAVCFPFASGASWTYQTHLEAAFMGSRDEEVTDRITGTRKIGDSMYWVFVRTGSSTADTSFIRVDGNDVYAYIYENYFGKTAPGAAKTAAVLNAMQNVARDALHYRFGVAAGTSWEVYSGSWTGTEGAESIVVTGKYLGDEAVGTYGNCAKYELLHTGSLTAEGETTAFKIVMTYWFAPNIGAVKITNLMYYGEGQSALQLFSTQTINLTSYHIPK